MMLCCPPASRRRGRTLDQEAADFLAGFSQEKQRAIASGFRAFSDHIT
jgi:hypothetical protein